MNLLVLDDQSVDIKKIIRDTQEAAFLKRILFLVIAETAVLKIHQADIEWFVCIKCKIACILGSIAVCRRCIERRMGTDLEINRLV